MGLGDGLGVGILVGITVGCGVGFGIVGAGVSVALADSDSKYLIQFPSV